jgi:hypothetical protein
MAQLFSRSVRTDDVPVGRRAVASLALVAGALSGVATSTAVPVGAAPADIGMICVGNSGDIAATTNDPEWEEGGFDSEFVAGYLTSSDSTGASPLAMVTVELDHDLPDVMSTADAALPVNVTGAARLSDSFFETLPRYQVQKPFKVDATTHATLDGSGVSASAADDTAATVTQPPSGPGTEFPVNLALTATPTADGGAYELNLTMDLKLRFDQAVTSPINLELGTLSMSCEAASDPHDLNYPYYYDDDDDDPEGFRPSVRLPQPVAEGFVAHPGGVVARTDRAFETDTTVMVPVLDNDGSLDPERSIDPATLKVVSTGPAGHWGAEVMVHDGALMITPEVLRFPDLYDEVETMGGGYGGVYNPPPGIIEAGFGDPMLSLSVVYEVCDDGNPASCAEGLANVTVGVDQIDPCDDPDMDVDCGPSDPPVDTTCTDDMSICEVPGCSWSDDDDRYVCTYPGKLKADPNDPKDPPSGPDDPPSSNGDPPSGNGPGNGQRPPPGAPLTPAFTA